jgi:hypothetical protein
MIKDLCIQWHSKQPGDKRYLIVTAINADGYMVEMAIIIIIYGIVDASGSGF